MKKDRWTSPDSGKKKMCRCRQHSSTIFRVNPTLSARKRWNRVLSMKNGEMGRFGGIRKDRYDLSGEEVIGLMFNCLSVKSSLCPLETTSIQSV